MISKLKNPTQKVVSILEELKTISKEDTVSIFHIALKQFCEKFKLDLKFDISESETTFNASRAYFSCEAIVDGLKHGTHLAQSKREAKSLASMSAMAKLMTLAETKEGPLTKNAIEFFTKFTDNYKKR